MNNWTQGDLFAAKEGRDRGMAQVEAAAGETFSQRAQEFVIEFLQNNGPATGEALTNACKAVGIRPHSDKAFGPVIMKLCRDKRIFKVGNAKRLKGHCSAGANIWTKL